MDTLLDTCAGTNSVTEEVVVGIRNKALSDGISPSSPNYPIVQLEKWPHDEVINGVASGKPVPLLGGVVLRIMFREVGKETGPTIEARFKICRNGTSDFHGLILGARALDHVRRGGLGLHVGPVTHVLEGLGIQVERKETIGVRPDRCYNVVADRCHAITVALASSCVDSEDEHGEEGHDSLSFTNAVHSTVLSAGG